MKIILFILFLFVIIFLYVYLQYNLIEPYLYTNYPFWNISLENTRNMSYDIRGDPYIPRVYTRPWNQSTLNPINNRLYL